MSHGQKPLTGFSFELPFRGAQDGPFQQAENLVRQGKVGEALKILRPLSAKSLHAERAVERLEGLNQVQFGHQSLNLLQAYFPLTNPNGAQEIPTVLKRLGTGVQGGKTLREAYENLSAKDQKVIESQVGGGNLREILFISEATNAEEYYSSVVHFGVKRKMTFRNKDVAVASHVLGTVIQSGDAVPEKVLKKAQRELDAIIGRGDAGLHTEFLAGTFVGKATDWKMIAPMVLAAPVYHLGKTAALRGLLARTTESALTRGFGARAISTGIGLTGETAFFSLSSRGLTHLFEAPVAWDAKSLGKDFLAAGLTLGFLKSAGFLGRRATMWARNLDETAPQLWAKADHRALFWSGQASGYLGLVGAHKLETLSGLRPHIEGSNIWLDALSTHIALGVGSQMGRGLLGSRFHALEHQLSRDANMLYKASNTPRSVRGEASPLEYLNNMIKNLADQFNNNGWPPGMVPAGAGLAGGAMAMGPHEPYSKKLPSNVLAMTMKGEAEGPPRVSSVPPVLDIKKTYPLEGRYVAIGNRGEPAVRAVREAQELGAIPIVFVSEADRESLHANMEGVIPIYLPGNTANETYNNIPARLKGLQAKMGELMIRPEDVIAWEGWGFKSEDADNFKSYEDLGIKVAGAPSHLHRLMGDKVSARRVAQEAGVPVVPGSEEIQDVQTGLAYAKSIGFPVIVKGKDTGGGKGIRVVFSEGDFEELFDAARREALSTSGSDAVFIEKFIPRMRHIEAQIVADGQGNFVVAGIRECTLQRSKQKVIEEDVTNFLDSHIKDQAFAIANQLMKHPKLEEYKGPGTIEMIWDVSTDQIYFMEMNTRLQVEHTVTEMVTGKNLLKAQLELGSGLPLSFDSVNPQGHSIEARITAEDPYNNFQPSTGKILHYSPPPAHKTGRIRVRVDTGVEEGREISQHYDSMIAKLIVWGETRQDAVEGVRQALNDFEILGVKTNIPFLKALTATPQFREGRVEDTKFIEDVFLPSEAGKPQYVDHQEAVITAAIQTYLHRKKTLIRSKDIFIKPGVLDPNVNLEFNGQKYETSVYESAPGKFLVKMGDSSVEVGVVRIGKFVYNLEIGGMKRRSLIKMGTGTRDVLIDNVSYGLKVVGEGDLGPGFVTAPMPGKVVAIHVKEGQKVEKGDRLLTTEAMKMETAITAQVSGTIKQIFVEKNGQVGEKEALVEIEIAGGDAAESTEVAVPQEFTLEPSVISRIAHSADSKPDFSGRRALMGSTEAFFSGYDVPVEELLKSLQRIKPSGFVESRLVERGIAKVADSMGASSPRKNFRQDLQKWLGKLLADFRTVETVFLPANRIHWLQFLSTGEIADPHFEGVLKEALSLHGVNKLDPGPDLEQALFLLNRSHDQRLKKVWILSEIMGWIPEMKMGELDSSLAGLEKLYVDGVSDSFRTQIATTRRQLGRQMNGEKNGFTLEKSFNGILKAGDSFQEREQAIGKFFGTSGETLQFLVQHATGGKNTTERHLAVHLLQRYLYGERYQVRDAHEIRGGMVMDMEPNRGTRNPYLQVALTRLENGNDAQAFENRLQNSIDILQIPQALSRIPASDNPITTESLSDYIRGLVGEKLKNFISPNNRISESTREYPKGNGVIEIILPSMPAPEVFSAMEAVIARRLKNQNIDRVTLIIQKPEGAPEFRTYELGKTSGRYEENTLLRHIHPLHAKDLRIDRWFPNFDISRKNFGLFDHVHAYHAVEKNPKNPARADQRHIVIGEHRGELTFNKFDGERIKNRLLSDYRKLKNDPNYAVDDNSKIVWAWLPYALKETGLLASKFDPFSIGVLRLNPHEMIQRFGLDEDTLGKVSQFYDGKVWSVPEAEQVAKDTALTMQRLQGSQGKPLPALAEIFIHKPVEMSDAELKLLIFRLTPGFMGRHIEKTTIHFKREVGGRVNPLIAEVKIPGQTHFEVKIKPAIPLPPAHEVRSPVDLKRTIQRGRGKHYVYDRVNLFQDIIKDFYPRGNIAPDAMKIQELVLNKAGQLVPTDREIGKNTIGKVAFLVDYKVPNGERPGETVARQFIVIADDYTFMAGSQGTPEGEIYKAVSDYAIQHGIPKLYLAESSGARIGFAKEVLPFTHRDAEKNINYVLSKDLEEPVGNSEKKLKDIIRTGTPYQVDGETRLPLQTIIGLNEINTESLNASGLAGESESRARANVPTATITFGTTIGISTYLARLSEFVIMVKNSFLGLTGRNAINNTMGTNYQNELEVAGPQIMADAGVAYKVVADERAALKAYLKWLSYQPVRLGKLTPLPDPGVQPPTRDIGAELNKLIPGRGQKYDTKELDKLVFDEGSVWYVQDEGFYGRYANVGFARLGGVPVGIISMEMNPKMKPGEKQVYPGGLDPSTSNKVASFIRHLNRLGLPLIFNASITGFLPRDVDHLNRVIPAGASILDALREFDQAAIIWTPPLGFLYGGAWVVIDKNINPNVVMVADKTALMGILGSQAANDLPLVSRHRSTEEDYAKTKDMLDAQNTPERALAVNSIHRMIEDSGKTPEELFEILQIQKAEVQVKKITKRIREDQLVQVRGALELLGLNYDIEGKDIRIRYEDQEHRVSLKNAQEGLARLLGGQDMIYQALREIVTAHLPLPKGTGNIKDE